MYGATVENPMDNEQKKLLGQELGRLNAEWDAITAKRKAWMDDHMKDFAQWPIGAELFCLADGSRFGIVTKYYRVHADGDPRYDRSMSIEYEVETAPRCFDNTSRTGTIYYGTVAELIARRETELRELQHLAPKLGPPAWSDADIPRPGESD